MKMKLSLASINTVTPSQRPSLKREGLSLFSAKEHKNSQPALDKDGQGQTDLNRTARLINPIRQPKRITLPADEPSEQKGQKKEEWSWFQKGGVIGEYCNCLDADEGTEVQPSKISTSKRSDLKNVVTSHARESTDATLIQSLLELAEDA